MPHRLRLSEELTRKEMIDPQLEIAGWYLHDYAQEHAKMEKSGR